LMLKMATWAEAIPAVVFTFYLLGNRELSRF